MEKNLDSKGRWRNKIVAFRVSPEEAEQIDACVRLSGLSKQDYITKRLTCREIVVQGNPRVYKALRNQMAEIYEELKTEYSQYRTAIEKWKKETGKEPVAHGIRAKLAEKKQKIQKEQKNKQHTRSQNTDRGAR